MFVTSFLMSFFIGFLRPLLTLSSLLVRLISANFSYPPHCVYLFVLFILFRSGQSLSLHFPFLHLKYMLCFVAFVFISVLFLFCFRFVGVCYFVV